MKKLFLLIGGLLGTLLYIYGCRSSKNMQFEILQQEVLEDLPSASGIVKHLDTYYAIGDDSPFLFKLDSTFKTITTYPILSVYNPEKQRIAKKDKPDFEALELISAKEMVAFGSGSKSPERDQFLRILIDDSLSIKQYALTAFYQHLKNQDILKDSELNIEALAYGKDQLYLFNRRRNIIFSLSYQEFLAFLEQKNGLPVISSSSFKLPEINGIEAGLSGATISKKGDQMLLTCSVENTNNAYDDGEILGSFIGVMDLTAKLGEEPIEWISIITKGEPLKVESITIDEEIDENNFNIVLITDSDGAESLVLKGNLKW